MDYLQFLNTLENTLDNISVCGKENVLRMTSIYEAIDTNRTAILQSEKQMIKKDGEGNGRQSDNGTVTSLDSNGG